MERKPPSAGHKETKRKGVLVAIDFSHCSRLALRRGKSWIDVNGGKILALHVIDKDFIKHCVQQNLGTSGDIKKKVFINSKKRLKDFILSEGIDQKDVVMIVCEGAPCIEINKKAVENDVDMIIMGSKGNSDDMKAIFFGSTTEKVLRFIKRPVLCIPPECHYNLK
jgi:nucleotide-binding universal stress UspA family protein